MRLVRWPLPTDAPPLPSWSGDAIILGDNAVARALKRQIEESGGVAHLLVPSSFDRTLAAFDQIWNRACAPHLFLLTGSDGEVMDPYDIDQWNRRCNVGIELPYFVCQRWIQRVREANLLNRATLVATTALGGDFGFSKNIPSAEGGWLTGLMKSLFIEIVRVGKSSELLIKAIDAPSDESSEHLADNILREVAAKTDDFEVAFVRGQRYLQNAYLRQVQPQQSAGIEAGSTWVVTGGARGITAACALELGKRFGVRLHLVGASAAPTVDPTWLAMQESELAELKAQVMRDAFQRKEHPPAAWNRIERAIEIARTLRTFAEAGVQATYHACDVGDRRALAEVLDEIRRLSGPIQGILHGAGIDIPRRFEKKEPSGVMATFAAKVGGAANLISLTQNDPIGHFIGFGSVSGRLGSNGQTDYAAASDMLCKLASWYGNRHPDCHVISFHWSPWDEVGMAARPENRVALKVKDAPKLMPKEEGVQHFIRELYDGGRPGEVLIIDPVYHKLFYNKGEPSAVANDRAPEFVLPEPANELPAPESTRAPLTERFVLRLIESPGPRNREKLPDVSGAVYILGKNAVSDALAKLLKKDGEDVTCLDVQDSVENAVQELELAWSRRPGNYLLITTPCDAEAGYIYEPMQWQQRLNRGVTAPYLVCQRWWQLWRALPERTKAIVAAVTRMGGDYGLSGNCIAPEGGAMAGMLKSLFVEDLRAEARNVRVRVIDTRHDDDPSTTARSVLKELSIAESSDIEVGWLADRRFVLRPMREDAPVAQSPIDRNGVWVVSGGACGISAVAALELGRRYNLKLHLLGRTPVPAADAPWRGMSKAELEDFKAKLIRDLTTKDESPQNAWQRIRRDIEIWNNLEKFAAAGVSATYHSCDVADCQAVMAVLDQVRRHDGPITGILHGAGTNNPSRFERKPRRVVEEMVAAKVAGAWNLMALTRQDPVRAFIGFGSVTGRFGGNGMTDYAAVNDMLAKLVAWYRRERPDCRAVCFSWESWADVGMAVAPRHVMAGIKGKLEFMPPAEGIAHIVRELEAGAPEAEIIFTRDRFIAERYPHVLPVSPQEATPIHWPLIDGFEHNPNGTVVTATLDPVVDPFLREHRLRDKPLMPAVIGMELLAESVQTTSPDQCVTGLADVEFVDGLRFSNNDRQSPQIVVESEGAGAWRARLSCDFRNRSGKLIQANRPYLRGVVQLADSREAFPQTCPAPPEAWRAFKYEDEHTIYHGPCLRGVTATTFDNKVGWAKLVALPLQGLAGHRSVDRWILPSTLLDAAFYACGIHVWFHGGQAVSLPRGIRRLLLGRTMRSHERCLVRFVCQKLDAESAEYDFTIFGEDGAVIVIVEGYRKVLLRQRGSE